ncbi:MAG TPA: lipoprotein signal peptidase [Flavobacteriales bacterium]|nr:lipoprotein signal peptidase [Flavobacteriales bacterium]HRP81911.1 lipoprotein signal peptidase [Flavobacteriales bacterium]HRQ83957.1 lipoprotein signal peptidase [Flavobacteriales bacterium]
MKRPVLIILLVLLADQLLKFWVKLSFFLGESIPLFGEGHAWAYLQFVENKGMAFGLEFGGEAGKMALTLFRMAALVGIGYLLRKAALDKQHPAMATSLALVFAGALGNIIDSAFYGLIFDASTPFQKAVLFPPGGGYAPFLHGAVVDMFYFPLLHGRFPQWLPIWGGQEYEFFRPVFNIADAAISVGIVLVILVQGKHDRKARLSDLSATTSPEPRP